MTFNALLFFMLSGESKLRKRNKLEIKMLLFLVLGHLGWTNQKGK